MFGYQETRKEVDKLPMKEEPISAQLGTVRNWMQPTMVEQSGGRRVLPNISHSFLLFIMKIDIFNVLPVCGYYFRKTTQEY